MNGYPVVLRYEGEVIVNSSDDGVQVRFVLPVDNTVTNEEVDVNVSCPVAPFLWLSVE